jgi:endo-1,3-1,4-beta-glycanase ExoK
VSSGGASASGGTGTTSGTGGGAATVGGAGVDGGAPAGAGGLPPSTGTGGLSSDAGTAGTGTGSSGTSGNGAGTFAGGTGGTGGATGGAAGAVSADGFTLLFRDDFDALDLARWQLMTHSWEGNLALFSASAVTVDAGELRVALTAAPPGTVDPGGAAKSFLGAEVRSVQAVSYGRVRARMRFARGSAVVSSLVTIYTPWPADNWNELDIECLGKDPAHTQFNAMVYTGPPVIPPVTTSVTPTQEPQLVDLGFDPSTDFHVYVIEWTPAGARFLVDDMVRHTWNTHIELMGLPQNVLMTIWASASVDWAGPVNETTGQAVAVYDWLEVYEYASP